MKSNYQDKLAIDSKANRVRYALQRLFLNNAGNLNSDAEIIMNDLRKFCKAKSILMINQQQGSVDPYATMNANGRREVYDYLCKMLYLNDKQITEVQYADMG